MAIENDTTFFNDEILTIAHRCVKLTVTYDGSAFFGYQYQPGIPTIQGELERAFRKITGEKQRAIGAGRTDAGVHAVEQVVLLRIQCPIPVEKLIIGMNSALPGALRISRANEVNSDFHPCFSATGKHYRYLFRRIKKPSPFLQRFFWQIDPEIDVAAMNEAAELFVGEHDFASFAKSPHRYKSTVRRVLEAKVSESDEIIQFDVIGTGFMHNMVRNMSQALYLIGRGEMSPEELKELYRNQNRRRLGAPAPPGGLYLMKVMY